MMKCAKKNEREEDVVADKCMIERYPNSNNINNNTQKSQPTNQPTNQQNIQHLFSLTSGDIQKGVPTRVRLLSIESVNWPESVHNKIVNLLN